jgi:hypothetical protein
MKKSEERPKGKVTHTNAKGEIMNGPRPVYRIPPQGSGVWMF